MAVYSRGAVSYGAAVAALVATMGDASWVLLAAEPVLTLKLKVLLVITGAVTGYIVDAAGLAPRLRRDRVVRATGSSAAPSRISAVGVLLREAAPSPAPPGGAVAAPALTAFGPLPLALWMFLAGGLVVSLPVTFQLLDPAALGESLFGGVDPYLALGAMGTALCLVAFVRDGCKVADDDPETANPSSLAEVLRHGGREVAFVTVWVAFAYVA
ncbi:hypothetical protein H1W00_08070 [Aeromicrobium sp. Marseille-Q0843]|uniref:Uncharacterized protein n=1 Tax=Aeromicrobium phoceense TaxID=2754045 RepID=A0A838XAC4_9ACTN|nr:hypothetical protein [Aeromicrobium phoceense]